MDKADPQFRPGEEVLSTWRDRVHSGEKDRLYPVGNGALRQFQIGPGRVVLVGGPPGAGKTAFAMQAGIDALRLNEDLKLTVCNIEMSPEVLMDRQAARLSGIELNTIRDREFTAEQAEPLDLAVSALEKVAPRLAFVSSPYDLGNVAAVADATNSNMILLDYIQRIPPGDSQRDNGHRRDKRGSVDATMDYLRQFADEGIAVLVIAAVARTKDSKGRSSYDSAGLNLASFRESSELEFGADDAYILVPRKGDDDLVVLKHLKARHSEIADIELVFDRSRQRFTSVCEAREASAAVSEQLRLAWNGQAPKGGTP